jgi:hypothetical protein
MLVKFFATSTARISFARGGLALEGRLGLHVLEDTTEGVVIVDILEDLTAAGLQEHPSKHVGLRNQDTVGRGLQEEPDERAFRVDVGVRETVAPET